VPGSMVAIMACRTVSCNKWTPERAYVQRCASTTLRSYRLLGLPLTVRMQAVSASRNAHLILPPPLCRNVRVLAAAQRRRRQYHGRSPGVRWTPGPRRTSYPLLLQLLREVHGRGSPWPVQWVQVRICRRCASPVIIWEQRSGDALHDAEGAVDCCRRPPSI